MKFHRFELGTWWSQLVTSPKSQSMYLRGHPDIVHRWFVVCCWLHKLDRRRLQRSADVVNKTDNIHMTIYTCMKMNPYNINMTNYLYMYEDGVEQLMQNQQSSQQRGIFRPFSFGWDTYNHPCLICEPLPQCLNHRRTTLSVGSQR